MVSEFLKPIKYKIRGLFCCGFGQADVFYKKGQVVKNILSIIFSVIILAFGLAGCTTASITSSMMSGVANAVRADNALVFDLSAPAKFSVRGNSKHIILAVLKPTALKSLERSSIVVKTSKHKIA